MFNDALQTNVKAALAHEHINKLSEYFDLYPLKSETAITKQEAPLLRALNGERIRALEFIMTFKNGISRNVVIDGQPIINIDGSKLGAVIAIHDVTQVKKTEKMKNEFVSVVSHELRTPLTSIRGSMGLLLGGAVGKFSDKAAKLLDIANKNCERLLLLINDILDMEKIQAGKMKFDMKICDINKLVNESIVINRMYAEKFGVGLELSESVNNIGVNVDPDRLLQVLANLISNAAKFSTPGGMINLKINTIQKNVRVSVCDNGSGIPMEFQSRIFQKFSQADSSSTRGKGGTGLGLSISKAIVEKNGGTLNFVSKPGVGSTFYIDLPIFGISKGVETITDKKSSRTAKKLLICEDDEDQANYISVLLESSGIESDISNSVAQAKRLLAQNTYDGILLDLILPDEDGITFIRELRKLDGTRELPIIVLSMITEAGQELLNGDALLVHDWLDKPVNHEKLLQSITRIKHKESSHIPNILHVEDDADTQHVIAVLLENSAKVTSCATIKETVQKLGHINFDLVILDLLLPDGSGSDLLPIFAKYKLPIIVYSALDLDSEFGKYVSQSLVKSKISNEDLLATIIKFLEEPAKEIE